MKKAGIRRTMVIIRHMRRSAFCVTDMNVTPLTVGLFAPKIVIPKVMPESYSREELRSVIQHERTHIRLGHLWFGLA